MSEEVQEESSKSEVRTLVRDDVENLILNKIVESINMHSSIGALHSKLLMVELQRDKLLHRVTNLQRQVVDLTKAVRSMSENVGRNGSDTQAYQPIRFYRSVGLQVAYNNIQPSLFKEPGESNGILRTTNNNVSINNGPPALLSSVNGLKRTINKPVVSVADVTKQVELEKQQIKIQKLSPNASPGTNALTSSPPKRNHATDAVAKMINGIQSKVKVIEPGVVDFVVDLTDDDSTLPSKSLLTTPITDMTPTTSPLRFTTATQIRPGLRPIGLHPEAKKYVLNINQLPGNNVIAARLMPTVSQSMIRPVCRPVTPDVKKYVLPPLPPPSTSCMPRRCPKDIPPRPDLTLQEQREGIVLSWTLKLGTNHAEIQTYQIYACQEPLGQTAPTKAASWKRVGDVKALPLPMACTLSQFAVENRYHFIVRGVDVYDRTGPFCEVTAITLKKKLV